MASQRSINIIKQASKFMFFYYTIELYKFLNKIMVILTNFVKKKKK